MSPAILGPLRIGGPGEEWRRVMATLRDAVGPAAFTSAVAEGASLTQADAVALAQT
jgi:hypothetical protein